MRNIPAQDRPRERLVHSGAETLSLIELLAILLVTGTREKPVLILAQELVQKFGGLHGLLEASVAELQEIKGIGEAKAIQLKAVFAIAERTLKTFQQPKPFIRTPKEAYTFAKEEIAGQKQEVLLVLLRDIRGRLIHHEKVSVGTLSEVLVHPREVFYPAVRHKAHSLILAHNHPSGDPTPSQEDCQLTRVLMHSSKVMGIGLDDHLIIGKETFVSLRERGYLGTPVSPHY
jgi:DNA repair protein RadC